MRLNKKIIITITFTISIMLIIGFSYAKFVKSDIVGSNNYNIVMGNTISESELNPSFVVTYDEGSNIIDTGFQSSAFSKLIKIKVATIYDDTQTIAIKLDTVANDTYNNGSYNLYSCNQTNYNNATLENVSSNCTLISSTTNHYLPNTNEIKYLASNTSITISANSTNYYVLTITTITTSNIKRYKGIVDVVSYSPTTNENLLANKIQTTYSPVADNIASTYVSSSTGIAFNTTASTTNGQGLYINSKSNITNDPTQGTIKYFRGTVNNYVSFAGMVWRVIRINADNSIRIITDTNPITGVYNSTQAEKYVGYTYDDSTVSTNDGTASNVKNLLDTWYTNNLASYASYIVQNASFCNDTTVYDTSIHFMGYQRIYSAKTPTFSCPVTLKTYGGEYFLPIATITADEILYSGLPYGSFGNNFTSYLNNGGQYWSMTPFQSTSATQMLRVYPSYMTSTEVSSGISIRPVINLKANTLVVGTGTSADPWVVQ